MGDRTEPSAPGRLRKRTGRIQRTVSAACTARREGRPAVPVADAGRWRLELRDPAGYVARPCRASYEEVAKAIKGML